MKRLFAFLAVMAVTIGATLPARAQTQPAEATSAPTAPLKMEDAAATIAIGDMGGFLDGLEGLAAQVAPGMSVKQMLGAQMGDPGLTAMTGGKGLAVALFPDGRAVAVVEVTGPKADAYIQGLQAQGEAVSKQEGWIVIARTEGELAAAAELAPVLKSQLLGAERKPVVAATIFLNKTLKPQEAAIESMLGMLPMMMMANAQAAAGSPASMQSTAQILEIELRAILGMVKQIDVMQINLSFPKEGIRIDLIAKPIAGTSLATFAANPAPPEGHLMKLLQAKGGLQADIPGYRPLVDFMTREALALAQNPQLAGIKPAIEWMAEWKKLYSGEFAFDFLLPAQGLGGTALVEVTDPNAVLAMLEGVEPKMKETGISAFYEKMGMPMTMKFVKNASEHSGVPIHKLAVDMDFSAASMPATQAAQMKSMVGMMTYQIAFVGNTLIYRMGSQDIGSVIDTLKAGAPPMEAKPQVAREIFGPGGFAYIDLRLGECLAAMAPMAAAQMPAGGSAAMIDTMAKGLSGVPPVSVAAFCRGGAVEKSVLIPSGLLVRCSQMGPALAMAGMQQQAAQNADPTRICQENLQKIDGAKEQWALENKKGTSDTPAWQDLVGDGKYIQKMPACPSGGSYTINPIGTKPQCSVAGHVLPE